MADEAPAPVAAEATPAVPSDEEFITTLDATGTEDPTPPPVVPPEGEKPPEKPAEKPPEADEVSRAAKVMAAAAARERKALEMSREAKAVIDRAKKLDGLTPERLLALAEESGLTPKQIVDEMLKRSGAEKVPTAEERIAALEAERKKDREQAEIDRQAASRASAITQTRTFIDAEPDRFDLIRTFGAYEQVARKIGEFYAKYGEEPDYTEVADFVEAELETKETARLKSSKKLAKLFTPAEPAPASTPATPARTATPGKTLTNSQNGRLPPSADELPLDLDERMAAVAKRLGLS